MVRTNGTILVVVMITVSGIMVGDQAKAQVRGSLTIGAGYLEHPLGVQEEPAAGYLSQALRISSTFGKEEDKLRLGYEGNANQFGNNTSLGSQRHGLGLEWFRNRKDGSQGLSAGIQGAVQRYQDYYEVYNYGEAYSYFAGKRYLNDRTLMRGFIALRFREFGDLPEESYLEPHGQVELQHFSENRTTVGLALKLGAKYYHDSVASRVWGTTQIPSVSQFAARLSLAKGLSDRTSLRGWFEARKNLSDFPRYVADDVFDSPLLDSYAHQGFDAFLAFKWLAPLQTWLEFGARYGDHDYGSLLFAVPEGGEMRQDKVIDLGLVLDHRVSSKFGKPRIKLSGGWQGQDSNLVGYTHDGPYVATSFSWQW